MQTKGNINKRKGHKPFRFEAVWIEVDDCEKVIANSWNRITGQATMGDVMRKISVCSENLMKWNKQSFGNVHTKIQQARAQLQQLQNVDPKHLRKDEH